MKIENEEVLKTDGDTLDKITATVDANKMSKMFWMFSNLYKNVLGSIIREYTSNCFDSHAEAKVDHPVIVKIEENPNTSQLYIHFIDVGVGLSPDRVQNVFMKYLSSTKEDTNDQIGGWGMGSKSGLAYQDSIQIQTVFNGTEWSYFLHKGEIGIPTLEKFLEMPTTKRNGTVISIKINDKDRYSLTNEVQTQLRYFDNVYVDTSIFTFQNEYKIYEGTHFKFNNKNSPSQVEIALGKVRYAIDYLQLGIQPVRLPIALKFEIGDLQVTPSREDILYSAVAKEKIIAKIAAAETELVDMFLAKYNPKISISQWAAQYSAEFQLVFPCGSSFDVKKQVVADPRYVPPYCEPIKDLMTKYGIAITQTMLNVALETNVVSPVAELNRYKGTFYQVYQSPYNIRQVLNSGIQNLLTDYNPVIHKMNSKYTILYIKELLNASLVRERTVIVRPYSNKVILRRMIQGIISSCVVRFDITKFTRGFIREFLQVFEAQLDFRSSPKFKKYSEFVPTDEWIKKYKEAHKVVVKKPSELSTYIKANVDQNSTCFNRNSLDHRNVSYDFINRAKMTVLLGTEESLASSFLASLCSDKYHKIFNNKHSSKVINSIKKNFPFIFGIASQTELRTLKKNKVKFKTFTEYMTDEFKSPELMAFLKWRRVAKAYKEANLKLSIDLLTIIRKDFGVQLTALKLFVEDRRFSQSVPSFVQELIDVADKKAEEAGYFNNLDELNLIKTLVDIQINAPMLIFVSRVDFTDKMALEALRDYCKKSKVKMDSHHYIVASVPKESSEEEIVESIVNEVIE